METEKKNKEENEEVKSADAEIMEDEQSEEKEDRIIEIKESEYKLAVSQAAEYKDKYLRLYAEFDNARKRMDRDRIEFVKYANEDLMVSFLGILDDIERTVQSFQEGDSSSETLRKGLTMVMKNIREMLSKNGVKEMDVQGKMFDPNCHEILFQEENVDQEDGFILEIYQKGYLFHEKVIRTAKVKVVKNN